MFDELRVRQEQGTEQSFKFKTISYKNIISFSQHLFLYGGRSAILCRIDIMLYDGDAVIAWASCVVPLQT